MRVHRQIYLKGVLIVGWLSLLTVGRVALVGLGAWIGKTLDDLADALHPRQFPTWLLLALVVGVVWWLSRSKGNYSRR